MEIDAFKITQKGGAEGFDMYVSTMKAIDLIERCKFDRWSLSNQLGYQRLPSENRLGDKRGGALRYLMREIGCFPTSILLNVRGELAFKTDEEESWSTHGRLDLGEEKLWVIDGQHRVEALRLAMERNAEFEKYPVIVSILHQPSRFNELVLFYVVNRRQRGIPTDLANRHLQRMLWEKGSGWLFDFEGPRAVRIGLGSEIVDELNLDLESPLRGRIRSVGGEDRPEYIATDRVFAQAISEVLREKVFIGVPVRDFAAGFASYWTELKSLYPEAFDKPTEYLLLSTKGVRALTLLFASVYKMALEGGPVTGEALGGILEGMKSETRGHSEALFRKTLDSGFWSAEKNKKLLEYSAPELSRSLAEKLRLATA